MKLFRSCLRLYFPDIILTYATSRHDDDPSVRTFHQLGDQGDSFHGIRLLAGGQDTVASQLD